MVDLPLPAPSGIAAARVDGRQRGIVLPAVLVMLLMMTVVVIFLMRRGTVDERIAFNVRQGTTLDTAAQFALRTCERLLWRSPPRGEVQPGLPPRPSVVVAPAASSTAAWRVNANWASNQVIQGETAAEITSLFGAGVTAARCLIEDATAELQDIRDTDGGGYTPPEENWLKYRITAEVIGTDGSAGRAQAEVRFRTP
jgi:Tfp pilus assembly protein PilX